MGVLTGSPVSQKISFYTSLLLLLCVQLCVASPHVITGPDSLNAGNVQIQQRQPAYTSIYSYGPSYTSSSSPYYSDFNNSKNDAEHRFKVATSVIVGLAVGLGLGIPLLITLGFYCCLRHRRNKRAAETYHAQPTSFQTAKPAQFMNEGSYPQTTPAPADQYNGYSYKTQPELYIPAPAYQQTGVAPPAEVNGFQPSREISGTGINEMSTTK